MICDKGAHKTKRPSVLICTVSVLLAVVFVSTHVRGRSYPLRQLKKKGCWILSSARESGGYLQIQEKGNSFIRLPKKGRGKIVKVQAVVQDIDFSVEFTDGAMTQYLGHLIGPANKHGIVLDNFI